jgi:hypothetical protein
LDLASYRDSGAIETTGIIAKIGFKVLQEIPTQILFQDSSTLPNAIDGTLIV